MIYALYAYSLALLLFAGAFAYAYRSHDYYSKWRNNRTTKQKTRDGVINGLAFAAPWIVFVSLIWAGTCAQSNYDRSACTKAADGYDLDSTWSFRNGCRVYLPTGQLVPIEIIRVTIDGQIIVDGEIDE